LKSLFFIIGILLWFPQTLSADQQESEGAWGDGTHYHQYERFYISNQPDSDALEQSLDSGVSVVISLRGESETDWNERGAAESLGLEFHQVPVNGGAPQLAAEPFQQISAIVKADPDAQILLHCASGNRAAAWLAVYLVNHEGLSPDAAIEVARANGLNKKGLETKVRALLDTQ